MGLDKCSYLTVINDEAYIPGAVALSRNLKAVNSSFPLNVLVPGKCEEIKLELSAEGISVIDADSRVDDYSIALEGHYWAKTFFKLQAFGLQQFSKLVLIDSDVLVLKNLDRLFGLPHLSAASAGPAIGLRGDSWSCFNSGLMVVEPSMKFLEKALDAIDTVVEQRLSRGMRVGDQDVLNKIEREAWQFSSQKRIPETYNVFWQFLEELCLYQLPNGLSDVAMVHFTGSRKPWHYSETELERLLQDLASDGKSCTAYVLKKFLSYLEGK